MSNASGMIHGGVRFTWKFTAMIECAHSNSHDALPLYMKSSSDKWLLLKSNKQLEIILSPTFFAPRPSGNSSTCNLAFRSRGNTQKSGRFVARLTQVRLLWISLAHVGAESSSSLFSPSFSSEQLSVRHRLGVLNFICEIFVSSRRRELWWEYSTGFNKWFMGAHGEEAWGVSRLHYVPCAKSELWEPFVRPLEKEIDVIKI